MKRLNYWYFEIDGKYGMTAGVLTASSKIEAEKVAGAANTYQTMGDLDIRVTPIKMVGKKSMILHQSEYWE
jgi:hypothetical protein